MDDKELQQQLIKIRTLIPKLQVYFYRRIKELPQDLQNEIQTVKLIPPMTSSGIERVVTVLEHLAWAQELAEEEIEKRDNQTSKTSSQNTQKEIEPPKTITDIKPADIKAPEHINIEIENRPASDEARIVQRETDNVKNNDENRQSINESDIIRRETNNGLTNNQETEKPIDDRPIAKDGLTNKPITNNPETKEPIDNKTAKPFDNTLLESERPQSQRQGRQQNPSTSLNPYPLPLTTKLNPGIHKTPELPFNIEELIEENRQQIKRYEKVLENIKTPEHINIKTTNNVTNNRPTSDEARIGLRQTSTSARPPRLGEAGARRDGSDESGIDSRKTSNAFPTNISAATTPVKTQEHADIETNNRPTSDEARIGLRQTSTSARSPRLGEAGARRDGSDESGIYKQEANTESTNNQATQEPKKSNPNQLPKPTTVDHASLPSVSSKPRMSLPQKENVKQITPQEKANPAPAEIDFGPYYQK